MYTLRKIFLYLIDLFFYYGSSLFLFFGFLLMFAFLIGGGINEDFIDYNLDKKWWLITAIVLITSGYRMMKRSQHWRNEELKRKVRRMFKQAKQARKNADKK